MGIEILGSKIMLIVIAILAAATAAIGVPFYLERQSDSQPSENDIAPMESSESEVKAETPVENNAGQNSSSYTLDGGVVIKITPAVTDGKIASPLTIEGTVPNSVSQARFTIRLVDPGSKVISNNSVSTSASGSGNGSTNFNTTLKFSTSSSGTGSLQITGAGDSITIPVVF